MCYKFYVNFLSKLRNKQTFQLICWQKNLSQEIIPVRNKYFKEKKPLHCHSVSVSNVHVCTTSLTFELSVRQIMFRLVSTMTLFNANWWENQQQRPTLCNDEFWRPDEISLLYKEFCQSIHKWLEIQIYSSMHFKIITLHFLLYNTKNHIVGMPIKLKVVL